METSEFRNKMPHTGELKELYNISKWVDKFD